jgi:hypothetical protein
MKRLLLLLVFLTTCLAGAQTQSTYGPNVFLQPPAPTWVYVDDGTNFSCSGTTCTITLGTATTAGSILVAGSIDNNYPSTRYLSSGTGAGGTWVNCSTCGASIASLWNNSLTYNLTGTGGSTSITMTLSSTSTSWDLFVAEFKCTANCTAITVDQLGTPVSSTTCNNSCPGASFTGLTGSSDLIVNFTAFNGGSTSVSSPYNWSAAPVSYALGSLVNPPTYVLSGNTDWIAMGIAFTAQSFTATYADESASYIQTNLVNLTQPLNVTNCYIYLSTGGTSGDKVDCMIVQQTSFGVESSTAACHGTYTETGATVNGWVNIPITGCTLTAGYWYVGYNTNDAGIGNGIWPCYTGTTPSSTACLTGSTNQSNTGNSGSYYINQAYGAYTSLQTVATQISNYQQSVYITGTPTVINSVSKKLGTF